MQPEEFAELVVMTVKNAMAPYAERFARIEAALERTAALETKHTEVRDRLFAVESRAMPAAPDVTGAVATGVAPIIERLARLETVVTRSETLEKGQNDLRDRIVAIETKAAAPLQPDAALTELRDRVFLLESKPEPAAPAIPPAYDDSDLRDRLTALDLSLAKQLAAVSAATDHLGKQYDALEGRLNEQTKEAATARERIAVLETRAPVPGPAGRDGKDGADGMGFDDISVEYDGERQFTFKGIRGERVKALSTFTMPVLIYRGVYSEGRKYEPGDVVTWAGSAWHCQKATTLKPDSVSIDNVTGRPTGTQGRDCWSLIAKKGNEGRAGRDGRDVLPAPVVSLGGGSK